MNQHRPDVICVPGSVAPAAVRYAPLVAATKGRANLHLKDLEVYREDTPPSNYSIDEETDAIDRFADSLGLDRFHLIGYSGGGFVSIAYAGMRPRRVLSLGLFEPALVPGSPTPEEQAFKEALAARLSGLTGPAFMEVFVREQVKPGAKVPPPPPPSPVMAKRPAGIAAMIRAFGVYEFDRTVLRTCAFPVYYGYGDQSHEEQELKAGILARLFRDIHVQRFEGVNHFVPPEEIYTPRHLGALVKLWERGAAPG